MPDLRELHIRVPPNAERQLIYNKWFIKPEQRLTKKPFSHRPNNQLTPNAPFFYEALYSHQELSYRPSRESEQKETALRRICADGQNLKLLAIFRK